MNALYTFLNYFSYLTPIVLLFTIVAGLLLFRQVSLHHRLLIVYLVVAFITDLLLRYFGFVSKRQYNLFIVPFFAFVELLIFGFVYYHTFFSKATKILWIVLSFVVLLIVDALFFSHLFDAKKFQTYSKVITNFAIIAFCLLFYWQELKSDMPNRNLLILNAGVILYFAVNLIIFSSLNFYVNAPMYLLAAFVILNILSAVFFYLFLIYHIWQRGKTPKPLRFG